MPELPTQHDFEDFTAWSGRDVLARDGDRLGAVDVIFLDEATDRPEWVLVRLDGDDEDSFVPLAGATVEERTIRVEQDRERVAAAPRFDVEDTLTVAEERRLYEHYGLAYSQEESSTVLPEGASADAPPAPPAEERPRLRRYVGAPVPAAPDPDTTSGAGADADQTPAAAPAPAAEPPRTVGTGVSSGSADATPPDPIPEPAPQPVPPEGGFQAGDGERSGGPLSVLKRRPAVPVALAGAIAGLIAVLALRRRR